MPTVVDASPAIQLTTKSMVTKTPETVGWKQRLHVLLLHSIKHSMQQSN